MDDKTRGEGGRGRKKTAEGRVLDSYLYFGIKRTNK